MPRKANASHRNRVLIDRMARRYGIEPYELAHQDFHRFLFNLEVFRAGEKELIYRLQKNDVKDPMAVLAIRALELE